MILSSFQNEHAPAFKTVASSRKKLYRSVFLGSISSFARRKTLLPKVNVFKLHFPTTPARTERPENPVITDRSDAACTFVFFFFHSRVFTLTLLSAAGDNK